MPIQVAQPQWPVLPAHQAPRQQSFVAKLLSCFGNDLDAQPDAAPLLRTDGRALNRAAVAPVPGLAPRRRTARERADDVRRQLAPPVLPQRRATAPAQLDSEAAILAEGEAIAALHAQIDAEYEEARVASVLSANAKTLAGFLAAADMAQRSGALSEDDLESCSWEAMVLVPRLAVLACLPALVQEGVVPLELFHPEPGSSPDAQRTVVVKMEALLNATIECLSDSGRDVQALQEHLYARLLEQPVSSGVNQAQLKRAFDALCAVSDVPMTARASDTSLLLQHTFRSP